MMFNDTTSGTVYWITGLSGAGKTTIGSLFYKKIKSQNEKTVFLDGDILRNVFSGLGGYSVADRRAYASSYGRLCKMLSDQGFNVICCTISMFDSVRNWNRQNIVNYKEIFLDVPMEVLIKRDQKGLYTKVQRGQESNVVGMDLKLELPGNPDVRILNDGRDTPEQVTQNIYSLLVND